MNIRPYIKQVFSSYLECFKDRSFLVSFIASVVLVYVAMVVNFYAGVFATHKASNFVTDLILDNIPVYNVQTIFVFGPVFLLIFLCALCFLVPRRIPFVLKSSALFLLVRSFFITLTHIGPFPERAAVDYTMKIIDDFTFGGDLFFSGHTGFPFLMALIFWNVKWHGKAILGWLFTATAIFFGAIVLMGHLHYSIDVLAAFFITYTVFSLAKFFFKRDWEIFQG